MQNELNKNIELAHYDEADLSASVFFYLKKNTFPNLVKSHIIYKLVPERINVDSSVKKHKKELYENVKNKTNIITETIIDSINEILEKHGEDHLFGKKNTHLKVNSFLQYNFGYSFAYLIQIYDKKTDEFIECIKYSQDNQNDILSIATDTDCSIFYEHFEELVGLIKSKHEEHSQNTNGVYILSQTHSIIDIQPYSMVDRHDTDSGLTIEDLYNDDFMPVSDHIIKTLNDDSKNGIALLHGEIGTGKTSYFKHLIKNVDKEIIFVPPNIISEISGPSLIDAFHSHKNSILLIEDAENILKHRNSGENQAVSTLLNLSDGIIGDVLNCKIICTFNCDIEHVDKALLRPGRLIAEYYFTKLRSDKVKNLASKIYGEDFIQKNDMEVKDMTLAEIFSLKNDSYRSTKDNKTQFGFIKK